MLDIRSTCCTVCESLQKPSYWSLPCQGMKGHLRAANAGYGSYIHRRWKGEIQGTELAKPHTCCMWIVRPISHTIWGDQASVKSRIWPNYGLHMGCTVCLWPPYGGSSRLRLCEIRFPNSFLSLLTTLAARFSLSTHPHPR